MKFLERALIVAMVLCTAFIVAVILAPASKPKKLNPIVRLTEGGRTFCTGTVIDETTIVTASHCIVMQSFLGMMAVRPDVEIRADNNLPIGVHAKPGYITTQLDTAILKGNFELFEPKKHTSNINELLDLRKPGKEFLSCGYPLGGDLQCTKTIYVQPENFMNLVKGQLLPGMSGGPTMTTDGVVVGVNVAVTGEYSVISPIFNIDYNLGAE